MQSLRIANVIFDLHGGANIVHENGAARALAFAYRAATPDGVTVAREDGAPLDGDALPGARARRGESFTPQLFVFDTSEGRFELIASCDAVAIAGCTLASLTFVDVTPARRANTELERALAARDEFVSIAAHELRSPLNALVLAIERLRLGASTLPADAQKVVRLAKRQADRLTHLVQNVLDVSKMRAQRFELDLERCDLCRVITDAVDRVAEMARDGGVDVRIETCENIEAYWDAVRIEQVVHNLLVNALKYGGATDVLVHLRREGERAHLTVRDHGPGVQHGDRARIFEPFERATTGFSSQSLGLGLYIVREIVSSHGGSIGVVDPPGGGAAFVVELPIRTTATEA